MRKMIVAAIGTICFLLMISGCQAQRTSGSDIITNILNADQDGVSYFLESKYDDIGDELFTTKEWRFSDGRFRMEMYEDGLLQTTSVFDGKELLFVDHDEKELTIFDSGTIPELIGLSPREQTILMIETMYDHYELEVAGNEKLLGRDVFVLELNSKTGQEDRMTIWVDKQNWIMLKTSMDYLGETIVTEPLQFELDPEVDKTMFEIENREQYTILTEDDFGSSAEVTLEGAAEQLQESLLIPAGPYVFSKAEVFSSDEDHDFYYISFVDEKEVPAFSYSLQKADSGDGFSELLSAGETITLRNTEAKILWEGIVKSIMWQENGHLYMFSVESNLKKEEALEIIEAMQPYQVDK